jgi:type I restriction enzyme, S subunit
MGEWRDISLGEVIELKRGYDLPRQNRIPGSIPLISSSGLTDYHAVPMVKGPGVVTGRYGTLGKVFYINEDFWPLNTTLYVCDFKGNDPRFISYFLRSLDFSAYSDKAAVPGLNRNHLHEARVRLPREVSEQEAIATILGALDDKIELNRRLNETLELIARAIYRDWFVDFGPTRAKQEGRTPYLASDLWSLFPDRLDDEGKPDGWTGEPLLKHAHLLSGGTPATAESAYWDGPIPWASAKDVSQCGELFLLDTERSITERGLAESSTRMIPKLSTVVVARGATTGRFCMFGHEMAMNQTCYALSSKGTRPFWVSCVFASLVDSIVHAAHGSVFDTITTRTVESAMAIIPGEKILDQFEGVVGPVFMRALGSQEESRALAQIRDLLLPRLLSGEIRVKGAEKMVGEST